MVSSSESSTDDDDFYLSSAARVKAMKKKGRPVRIENTSQVGNHNVIPDVTNSDVSNPLSQRTTGLDQNFLCNNRLEKESSPDVEIVIIKDDDVTVLENSTDSLSCMNASIGIDDDNYNVDVKIRWRSRDVEHFDVRKYETFAKIFQHYAEMEGVSEKQILISRGTKPINRTDTPASMNLRVIDILEGGIVNSNVLSEEQPEDCINTCKIKVQMSTKQKIVVDLKMDETFKSTVLICAEKLRVSPSKIKLSFDGDEISLTDTPESLDLEQEACIDLRIVTS